MRLVLALGLFLLPAISQARVFNYKDAEVAAYVRGTGGLSQLDQDSFANADGAGTSVSASSKYNYGAEVGFALGLSPNLHLRIGAEIINENPVNDNGVDSSGTSRYSLNSTVLVFNPNLAFEYVYSTKGNTRFYGVLGAGYANVNVTNTYTMTAAGTTALGVGDFKESMGANVLSGQVGVGLETLFTDNVTFMTDMGYRYMPVRQLNYTSGDTGFLGAVNKGDVVLNSDGSKRTLNLSGLIIGASFRFYLNFL
jgi:hypothetical protein